jgi:carboxypeptidase D
MELTLELSQDKFPAASRLPAIWQENKDALLALALTASLGGARGSVTSAASGAPVAATLYVKSSSGVQVPFYSDPATGFYARPLAPGRYTLVATAPGFEAAEAELVVPSNGAGVVKGFQLKPKAGARGAADEREQPAALVAAARAAAPAAPAAPAGSQAKGR